MPSTDIISYEPATGVELWRGAPGDVDATVDRARRAWPAWAAKPLANRIELVRRFANEVRKRRTSSPQLIARETGKPLWEARTEVEAVIAKVDISVSRLCRADRAEEARQRAAGHRRGAPQAARGDGGAGALQLPRAPAQRAHRPRADRGQRGDLQAEREDPRGGRIPRRLLPPRRDFGGGHPAAGRRAGGRAGAGRAPRRRRGAVHRQRAGRHRDQQEARHQSRQDRRARDGRQQPDRGDRHPQDRGRGGADRAERVHHRGPALHRRAAADREEAACTMRSSAR